MVTDDLDELGLPPFSGINHIWSYPLVINGIIYPAGNEWDILYGTVNDNGDLVAYNILTIWGFPSMVVPQQLDGS